MIRVWYEDRLVGVLVSDSSKVLAYGILVPLGARMSMFFFLLYDGELCSAPDHQAWIVRCWGGGVLRVLSSFPPPSPSVYFGSSTWLYMV